MHCIEWWHCQWPWVTLNLYVIAMTFSVLKGRFPMQACALSQRRSASAEVSMYWCWNVHSLVPKCLGAELSGHFGTKCLLDTSALVLKCLGSKVSGASCPALAALRHCGMFSQWGLSCCLIDMRHRSVQCVLCAFSWVVQLKYRCQY